MGLRESERLLLLVCNSTVYMSSSFADALAESVAECTQRPLYAINVGEVTSEALVRAKLQQVFIQASRWNAVLLLDEADVVLEKRSFEDIRRNGTVSGKGS